MTSLTAQDIPRFRDRLLERRDALRADIADALSDTGREDLAEIIGRVRDSGEDSVAELVASTHLTLHNRAVGELSDVEAALGRIRNGTYGVCIDCGAVIERERLDAYPTAKRCFECQQRHEALRSGGRDHTPSL